MTIANLKKPVVVSTCSGNGGFDKGAKLAGFECIYQSDIWDVVESVFKLNCKGNSLYPISDYRTNEGAFDLRSIEEINFENMKSSIEKQISLQICRGEIDLYISGSPCQDGSAANPFRTNFAYRNKLMFDQYKIAYDLKVKVGLFENVEGMTHDIMKDFFAELGVVWKRIEKDYHIIYDILNAKHFDSRQDRDRFIVMIVRKDLGVTPTFPNPKPINTVNYMHNLLPSVTHYYSRRGLVPTYNKIFRTMTASDTIYFHKNGVKTKAAIDDLLILSHLEGYNLNAVVNGKPITIEDKIRLLGNMVQIPFAYHLTSHIKREILKVS